jgi:hypothetical protein
MAFGSFFDGILGFLTHNWLIILLVGAVFYFGWSWIKNIFKGKIKQINRSEIERKNFIKRMKLNKSINFDWLYRGDKILGRINGMKRGTVKAYKRGKDNKIEIVEKAYNVYEFAIKPHFLFNICFGKEMPIVVLADDIEENKKDRIISISNDVDFDLFEGIYYPKSIEKTLVNWILYDSVFRTDWENMTNIYFAKSQEQSTFSPEFAHEVLMKQQELAIERAKREKVVSNN